MAIRKFRTGQMSYAATTYVGTAGTIFYDEDTGALRISDGATPGGSLISYPVASSTKLGGIKLGPGVVLNSDDQIIIDSEGLDFSFGDLAGTVGTYTNETDYAVLSTINDDEDMVLASNGTGAVCIVGELHVHATNGSLTETLETVPAFTIQSDGQVKMLVPTIDSVEGAVSIIGSATGEFVSPVNTGVMLHVTGQYDTPPIPSRIYNDAQGSFAAFVARRYNGTVASPTAVLADEELMRISGTAHNGTTIPGTGNQRIVYKALGNQTTSNQGGYMELWATPLNSTTIAKVITIDSTGITLESGKVLTGNVTGKADTAGNADTVTNGVYTNGSYANPSWITSLAASKVGLGNVENTALSTSTHYIGTTSIQYNRASGAQTLAGVSISGNAGSVTNGVYTTDTGTVTNTMLAGSIANAKLTNSSVTVNGTSIALGASATVTAEAGTLTGTTLNATVVTSSLTTVGTLGSLTVTNLVSAKNYNGQARNAGTLGAAGTLTIDFATDHNVLVTLTTTATIAFSNITAGKTVSVLIKNDTGANRAVTTGVVAGNTSGGNAAPNVNDGRTGVFVYRTFGTASTDVYCEVNP